MTPFESALISWLIGNLLNFSFQHLKKIVAQPKVAKAFEDACKKFVENHKELFADYTVQALNTSDQIDQNDNLTTHIQEIFKTGNFPHEDELTKLLFQLWKGRKEKLDPSEAAEFFKLNDKKARQYLEEISRYFFEQLSFIDEYRHPYTIRALQSIQNQLEKPPKTSISNILLTGESLFPTITAQIKDSPQITKLASGIEDSAPKLPDKLIQRTDLINNLRKKIAANGKLLLWSRMPKTTKTTLAWQLAEKLSLKEDIIYLRSSNFRHFDRLLLFHLERIRSKIEATVQFPVEQNYIVEDLLLAIKELVIHYENHLTIIIDDISNIDSEDETKRLFKAISDWPHSAILIADNRKAMLEVVGTLDSVSEKELKGYTVEDILELLEFSVLPSDLKSNDYATMFFAFCNEGYPPIVHQRIFLLEEKYREGNTVPDLQILFQKVSFRPNDSLAINTALDETVKSHNERIALGLIAASIVVLPKRCIEKVLGDLFNIQLPGELLQRLTITWLDENREGKIIIPAALKAYADSWLGEEKKIQVYQMLGEQLTVLHRDNQDNSLHIEADEWLDGVLLLLIARKSDEAVSKLFLITNYCLRNQNDPNLKHLIVHPLFFINAGASEFFTSHNAVLWEQNRALIFQSAEKHQEAIGALNNALQLTEALPDGKDKESHEAFCYFLRGNSNAFSGKKIEAKNDYVRAVSLFENQKKNLDKLPESIHLFIAFLLNPKFLDEDSLVLIVELLAKCGSEYYYRVPSQLKRNRESISLLPDILLKFALNDLWDPERTSNAIKKLKIAGLNAKKHKLNDLAMICFEAAAILQFEIEKDIESGIETYKDVLNIEQGQIDDMTYAWLRAKSLVGLADGFNKRKKGKESHLTYLKAIKAYNQAIFLDSKNELRIREDYLPVHARRRVAEFNRRRGHLDIGIKHLLRAFRIAGYKIRSNIISAGCLLADIATAFAIRGDKITAIRALDLAVLIAYKKPFDIYKLQLCNWVSRQRLFYEENKNDWIFLASEYGIGYFEFVGELNDELKEKSEFWSATAAYNLASVWIPFNETKAIKWLNRAEILRKGHTKDIVLFYMALICKNAIYSRNLKVALMVGKILFQENWSYPYLNDSEIEKLWTFILSGIVYLGNGCFSPEENPKLALELFELVQRFLGNANLPLSNKKMWQTEIVKAEITFRQRNQF